MPGYKEKYPQLYERACFRYVAVLDNDLKNRIADECTKKFPWNTENIHEAPALIVLCTVKGLSGYEPNGEASTTKGTHWQSFDAGMAADHFCLAARGRSLWDGMTKKRSKKFLIFPKSMMCPASSRWAIPKSYPLRMKGSL